MCSSFPCTSSKLLTLLQSFMKSKFFLKKKIRFLHRWLCVLPYVGSKRNCRFREHLVQRSYITGRETGSQSWMAYFMLYWLIHGGTGSSLLWRVGACPHGGVLSRRAQALAAQTEQLWCMDLLAPRHVGSSQTRAWTCSKARGIFPDQDLNLNQGTWDLPGSGLEPMSPALASGFVTTGIPGKSP